MAWQYFPSVFENEPLRVIVRKTMIEAKFRNLLIDGAAQVKERAVAVHGLPPHIIAKEATRR